jgi:hypothetical protein
LLSVFKRTRFSRTHPYKYAEFEYRGNVTCSFVFLSNIRPRKNARGFCHVARGMGAQDRHLAEKKDGHLLLGYTITRWNGKPTDIQRAVFYISPAITDIIIFSATEAAFALGAFSNDSWLTPIIFVGGELAPLIDFAAKFIKSTDIEKFEKVTGIHPAITRSIGGAVALAGAYLTIRRAKKIFLKTPNLKKENRLVSIAPFADVGAALIVQF